MSKLVDLASYHPGLTTQDIAAETGFPLDIAHATETPAPTATGLRILRDVADPERVILK